MTKPMVLAVADLKPADMEQELHALYDVVTDIALAQHARIALTSGAVGFSAGQMDAMPNLGLIAVNGVGLDAVDLAQAAKRGIKVSYTPDVLSHSVAEFALALALDLGRGLAFGDAFVRRGDWAAGKKLALGRSILTQRAGILGYGRIGRQLADMLRALGMQVFYHARSPKPDSPDTFCADPIGLAQSCDVLFVTAAGGAGTKALVNKDVLQALGSDGLLINVARGSVVDTEALIAALQSGQIAGAALDVFENEPHVPQGLIAAQNCVLAPHIGSATTQARRAMARLVLDNMAAFMANQPLPSQYEG